MKDIPPYLLRVPAMGVEEGQEGTRPTWDLAKPPWAPVPPNVLPSSLGKHDRVDRTPQARGRGRGGEVQRVEMQGDSHGGRGSEVTQRGLRFAVGQRGSNPAGPPRVGIHLTASPFNHRTRARGEPATG